MCTNIHCEFARYTTNGCDCKLVKVDMKRVFVEDYLSLREVDCVEFPYVLECYIKNNYMRFLVHLYLKDSDISNLEGKVMMGKGDALRSGVRVIL